MAIRASCDFCNVAIRVDDKHAGKRVRCPKCQGVFTVPLAASVPAADDGEAAFFEDSSPAAPSPPPPAAVPRPARPTAAKKPTTERPAASRATESRSSPPAAREDNFDFDVTDEPRSSQSAAAKGPVEDDDFSSLTSDELSDGVSVPEEGPLLEDAPRKPKKKKKKSAGSRKSRREAEQTGWRQHLHWLFLLALIPLCLNSLLAAAPLDERIEETIAEHQIDPENLGGDIDDDEYNILQRIALATPDHRINGALLAADSWLHWVFAGLSAAAFLGLFLLLWPKQEAGFWSLLGTGLVTGTIGIAMLLTFQFIATSTGGIRIGGRGIVALIFLVIRFIGFSYRCAIDPDTGFALSFMGFTCGVGLCEELCKAIPVAVYLNTAEKPTWRDACLIGLASGVGFGVSEGITYSSSYYNGLQGGWIYLVRFVSCVALHALWAGAIGVLMYHNQDYIGEFSFENAAMFVLFYLSAGMVLHGLYDTFLKCGLEIGALLTAGVSFGWFAYMLFRAREGETT